jgi:hypothetical protein
MTTHYGNSAALQKRTLFYDSGELESATASISLSSIPQVDGASLEILVSGRSTRATETNDWCRMEVNGDTTNTNYRYAENWGGGGTTAGGDSGQQPVIGQLTAAGAAGTNWFAAFKATLPFYASSDHHKDAFSVQAGIRTTSQQYAQNWAWRWANTNAITSLVFKPQNANFEAGTRIQVWITLP